MKRLLFLLFPFALFGQGQIEEPIEDPIPIVKTQLIIDHQNVIIDAVQYVDAKLVYECNPIMIKNCDKKKFVTRVDAIKTTAQKLTVEYRDPRLGKMSQVFLGAMPVVTEIKEDNIIMDSGENIIILK